MYAADVAGFDVDEWNDLVWEIRSTFWCNQSRHTITCVNNNFLQFANIHLIFRSTGNCPVWIRWWYQMHAHKFRSKCFSGKLQFNEMISTIMLIKCERFFESLEPQYPLYIEIECVGHKLTMQSNAIRCNSMPIYIWYSYLRYFWHYNPLSLGKIMIIISVQIRISKSNIRKLILLVHVTILWMNAECRMRMPNEWLYI